MTVWAGGALTQMLWRRGLGGSRLGAQERGCWRAIALAGRRRTGGWYGLCCRCRGVVKSDTRWRTSGIWGPACRESRSAGRELASGSCNRRARRTQPGRMPPGPGLPRRQRSRRSEPEARPYTRVEGLEQRDPEQLYLQRRCLGRGEAGSSSIVQCALVYFFGGKERGGCDADSRWGAGRGRRQI